MVVYENVADYDSMVMIIILITGPCRRVAAERRLLTGRAAAHRLADTVKGGQLSCMALAM